MNNNRAPVLLGACVLCFSMTVIASAQQRSRFVWPLSRQAKPIAPLVSTFGPRVNAADQGAYAFHRGIDIPAASGSPVYAIADGVVRLAGSYEYYSTPVVQLRHYKNASQSCQNGGCFYTNYMHLSKVAVAEGKAVRQGDLIGYSGDTPDEIGQLHFEVRDGGVYQQHCIHPLTVLPYQNRLPPKITSVELHAAGETGALTITLSTPRSECDLKRVDVTVFDAGRMIATRTYDLVELNRKYSPQDNPNSLIQSQDFQQVIAQPKFLADKQDYELTLIFYQLPGIVAGNAYQVKVSAVDAGGKSIDISRRLRAEQREQN